MGDIPRQRGPAETMARAAAGERDAFARLYASYERLVLRYVLRRVRNWHLAEDIAAATWVRALASVHGWVDQGRDPGAWLVTIARNLVLDYFKSRYRLETPAGEMLDDDTGVVPAHHDDYDARERVRELYAAIGRLTEDQRKVVLLRLNGLSLVDTARVVGSTVGSVKALQHRATRNLRRDLVGPDGREFDTPPQGIAVPSGSA